VGVIDLGLPIAQIARALGVSSPRRAHGPRARPRAAPRARSDRAVGVGKAKKSFISYARLGRGYIPEADILDGIEHATGSIAGLYRGENLGKHLIRIAPERV
jgi:hypothetical protein